jgi:hypothetical protein
VRATAPATDCRIPNLGVQPTKAVDGVGELVELFGHDEMFQNLL